MLRSFIQKTQLPTQIQSKDAEIFTKIQHDKLDRLIEFCQTGHCRRRVLLQYFEEKLPQDCNNCDACLNPQDKIDGLIIAQKLLSAIGRTGERFGANYILDILIGAENEKITQNGHQSLPTYGIGKDVIKKAWNFYLNQLIGIGAVEVKYDGFIKTLFLNTESKKILMSETKVNLIEYVEVVKTSKPARVRAKKTNLSESEQAIFDKLRSIRSELAAKEKVPNFIIFSDASLVDMLQKEPKTLSQFGEISGVGKQKQAKYWAAFSGVFG